MCVCVYKCVCVGVCVWLCWEILERNKLARLLEPNSSLCYHGNLVDVSNIIIIIIVIIVSKYININVFLVNNDISVLLFHFFMFQKRYKRRFFSLFLHYSDTRVQVRFPLSPGAFLQPGTSHVPAAALLLVARFPLRSHSPGIPIRISAAVI